MMLHLRTARVCLPAHSTRGVARHATRGGGKVRAVDVVYYGGTSAGAAITDCTVVTEPGRRARAVARPPDRNPAR